MNTGSYNAGSNNTGNENPGDYNSGNYNRGNYNSGSYNLGSSNSGNGNSGNENSGSSNSGEWNSGSYNSGYWNAGNCNSGHNNSGCRNSGNYNSGNYNAGNYNTGHWNLGNYNSGNWNSGNYNTGYLNTTEPTVRMFNKDTGMTREEVPDLIPDYFYFDLIEWIDVDDMTEEERKEHPDCKTTGGYLKEYGYKEAWRRSWDEASREDKEKTLELPNWDNEIFEEITGIDVEKELEKPEKMIEIDGKKYSEDTVKAALREYIN